MKLDHYSPQTLKKKVREIAKRHLDLTRYKLFFFGSRVTGNGSDRSDIDIGILGEQPVPFITIANIENEIDHLPTLYSIDLVDFFRVSDTFKEVALQKIEPIN